MEDDGDSQDEEVFERHMVAANDKGVSVSTLSACIGRGADQNHAGSRLAIYHGDPGGLTAEAVLRIRRPESADLLRLLQSLTKGDPPGTVTATGSTDRAGQTGLALVSRAADATGAMVAGDCARVLTLARELGCRTVAMPVVYTDTDDHAGGAAEATVRGIVAWLANNPGVTVVIVCVTDYETTQVCTEAAYWLPTYTSPLRVNELVDKDNDTADALSRGSASRARYHEHEQYVAALPGQRAARAAEQLRYKAEREAGRPSGRRVQVGDQRPEVPEGYVAAGMRTGARYFRSHVQCTPAGHTVKGVTFVGGVAVLKDPDKPRVRRPVVVLKVDALMTHTILDARGVTEDPDRLKPPPFYLFVSMLSNWDRDTKLQGLSLGEALASRDDGSPVNLINPARLPVEVQALVVWLVK